MAEVLGENGLLKFFMQEEFWYSTYFEVVDTVRGELGNGSLRKWYQFEVAGGGNSTVVGIPDSESSVDRRK